MSRLSDDPNNLLNQLDPKASEPDTVFQSELRSKYRQKLNGSTNLFNFSNYMRVNFRLLGSFLLLVLLAGAVLFILNPGKSPLNNNSDILAQIAEANYSSGAIKQSEAAVYNSTESATDKMAALTDSVSIWNPFVYSKSITKYQNGPEYEQCYGYGGYTDEYSVETVYFNKDTQFHSKDVVRDVEGNILSYNLNQYNFTLVYKGGDYAVKQIYSHDPAPLTSQEGEGSNAVILEQESKTAEEIMIEAPSETPPEMTTEEKLRMLFGEEFSLSEQELNGKEYYVVTSVYDYYSCDKFNEPLISYRAENANEPDGKQLILNFVDKDTLEIVRAETYKDEVDDDNLMMAYETQNIVLNPEWSDVQDEFEFDIDVEIIDVDLTDQYDSVKQNEEMMDALSGQLIEDEVPVFYPQSEYDFVSLYSISAVESITDKTLENLLYDRDFYPPGPIGDSLFEQDTEMLDYKSEYPDPIMTVNYSDISSVSSLEVNVFESDDVDLSDGPAEIFWGNEPEEMDIVQLNINGMSDPLEGQHFAEINDYTNSTDENGRYFEDPFCEEEDCRSTNHYIVFEFEDYTFKLMTTHAGLESLSDEELMTRLSMNLISPEGPGYESKIEEFLNNIEDKMNEVYSHPEPIPVDLEVEIKPESLREESIQMTE